MDPVLPPNTALLGSTERGLPEDGAHSINTHHTTIKLSRDSHCSSYILRKYSRHKTVASVVSQLDHLVFRLEPVDHRHGTKDLLPDDLGILGHISEDGGSNIVTLH